MGREREKPCWHQQCRLSVSHCRSLLDAPAGAVLSVSWTGGASIRVVRTAEGARGEWTLRSTGEAVSVPVAVAWHAQPFGGSRPWWVCPCCGARRGELAVLSRALACRRCIGAVYPSSRASGSRFNTALVRLRSVEERLRASPGSGGFGPPPRPKGMHRGTYFRLVNRWHDALLAVCHAPEHRAFMERMEREC